MKKIKKITRWASALLTSAALLCGMSLTVFAATDAASLDFSQTGSITVNLQSSDDGTTVQDGVLAIYQVADLYLDDGNMAYAYTESFTDCTEDLSDVTVASLAASLADYAENNGVDGTEETIGTDGTVTFEDLTLGVYLIVQTTKSTGYYTMDAFLVSLPMAEDGEWVYVVDASPKVAIYTETETSTEESPETLPQTGQLNWPVPILAASGLVLFAIGWYLSMTSKRKADDAA